VRQASDLQRVARESGSTLVSAVVQNGRLVGVFNVPDVNDGQPFAAAMLLEALASDDVRVGAGASASLVAQAKQNGPCWLHAWVKANVRFEHEETETFQSALATIEDGYGDCDDSERVMVVIARECGWPARFVYFCQDGQPAHVSVQVCDPAPPGGGGPMWVWAETTIEARYGEDPIVAAQRLGIFRDDIDGTPYVLVGGQPKALPAGVGELDSPVSCPLTPITSLQGLGSMTIPSNIGSGFAADLISYSQGIGADPLDVLKLLISESGLSPSAFNTRGFSSGQGAAGINQLAPVNWSYFQNQGYSVQQYLALTADQQLPIAFAYFQAVMQGHGLSSISGRDLYWLNYLPATYSPGSTDLHVIVTSSSGYYTANTTLDHGSKGFITAGDLQLSLDAAENTSIFQALAPQILSQEGGPTVPVAGLILGVAAFIGISIADPTFAGGFLKNVVG
jgi:Transglutaminase-like superfamily